MVPSSTIRAQST